MPQSTAELAQETDLIGTLTSVINSTDSNGATFTATFVDKKTGLARVPQTSTLEFTIDQDNSLSETILASANSTSTGITTVTFANNGRSIPKFGIGAGSNTGNTHQIGAAIGCVDIARPLNVIKQALTEKINTTGGQFTGLVNFLEPTGLLNLPTLTTAERNAIAVPTEGLIIENLTTGTTQIYQGGIWVDLGVSSPTANATTVVSGKIQLATATDRQNHTAIGSTGASLVPTNDALRKVSSGAADENMIPILNAAGQMAAGFIDLSSTFRVEKNGITTYDLSSASGTPLVIAHGCGKTPFCITIESGVSQNEGGGFWVYFTSTGKYNGTTTASRSDNNYNSGVGTGSTSLAAITNIIQYVNHLGGSQTFTVTMDATNITLTNVKVNGGSAPSGTLQIVWEAIA